MAINSKSDICNMALGHLGNYGTVDDIDTPTNDKEITFALWYDISRQTFLKMTMPNFALDRRVVSRRIITPPFGTDLGYQYAYEYPNDCLKVLGIGEIMEKENNYTVEGRNIWVEDIYENGLPIRFIADITDVTLMSPEFKMAFSVFLASNAAMDITQDASKAQTMLKMLPDKMASLTALNAQENMPIRISRSRFKEARFNGFVGGARKR